MEMLEASIARDGWIGAVTTAANGETFDGSARVEVTAETGMLDDAIVIDIDGTKPVVLRRTDIPDADDPKAKRLGIAANRIGHVNLEWEPDALATIAASVDLSGLFSADELIFDTEPVIHDASEESSQGLMHNRPKQVKVVLCVEQLDVIEQAILATGEMNRGNAITTICQAFMHEKR